MISFTTVNAHNVYHMNRMGYSSAVPRSLCDFRKASEGLFQKILPSPTWENHSLPRSYAKS